MEEDVLAAFSWGNGCRSAESDERVKPVPAGTIAAFALMRPSRERDEDMYAGNFWPTVTITIFLNFGNVLSR